MATLDIPAARQRLAELDPALRRASAAAPHYVWRRRPRGYAGLFQILVEQQISTAAAAAIHGRCQAGLGGIDPERVLAASPETLRGFGLTARKALQTQAIAREVLAGRFDFQALSSLSDEAAAGALIALPGVGRWTAEIYLLFAEERPDLCPEGDLALREALRLADLAELRPTDSEFRERALVWRPLRGHAAHLLWAYYAVRRSKDPPGAADRLGRVAKISQ